MLSNIEIVYDNESVRVTDNKVLICEGSGRKFVKFADNVIHKSSPKRYDVSEKSVGHKTVVTMIEKLVQ